MQQSPVLLSLLHVLTCHILVGYIRGIACSVYHARASGDGCQGLAALTVNAQRGCVLQALVQPLQTQRGCGSGVKGCKTLDTVLY